MRHDVSMPRLTHPPGMPLEVGMVFDEFVGKKPRLAIVGELAADGPLTTRELAVRVNTSQVSAFRHLQDLEKAGLVEADRPAGARSGSAGVRWTVRADRVAQQLDTLRQYLLPRDAAED